MDILKGCRNLTVLILSTTFIGEEIPDGDHMADFDGFQNLRILALRGCELTRSDTYMVVYAQEARDLGYVT